MLIAIDTAKMQDYLRRNWFRVMLLAILLVACFKKDLNFNIRFRQDEQNLSPARGVDKAVRPGTITQGDSPGDGQNNTALMKVIDLPSIGSFVGKPAPKTEIPAVDESVKEGYLKRFAQVAIAEHRRFGIPASVILGEALLQSYAGKRELAIHSNNQFALPCDKHWSGAKSNLDGACYRQYESAWASFRDHSLYLTSGNFSYLRQLPANQYEAWCTAFEKGGYAYDGFADELRQVIRKYKLYQLDKM